ncbi:TIGR03118 family protein [Mesorhizobium sp. BAC0120]|uniref:TIGR03118 family protein n=1 Tax=Mesorhizobium sp. BAC0120 TaxID=3090670 RepID=UPI00298BF65F|nr:TIGR03118 family protein [Mesorhizobium sp. BAC0120]MDW6024166.1 TIGR03118 family protein [Mesorhizobium sp. BAC0120]
MVTLVADPHPKAKAAVFEQTNLVSDGLVKAPVIDPNLINPWGVSFKPTGPFWVSDNGQGVATIYDGKGHPQTIAGHTAITIAVPPGQTTPASPTGQVFNSTGHGFAISSGGKTASSVFIFATEDGTISGWNPAVNSGSSVLAVDNSEGGKGAVYKGLAIAKTEDGTLLFAANFRSGNVDVFDSKFKHVRSFTDPGVPKGYAPFNVSVIDGHLFVTFALQNSEKHDDVAGAGHGFVDEFNLNGELVKRVASRGPLDSPWGMAIAPSGFGKFSHDLLIGNFGDGTINVFNPHNDKFLGKLSGSNGAPIKIGDLWALVPGNHGPNSDPKKIYFTAGVQNEMHGLFGTLGAVTDHHQTTTASMPSAHMLA